MTDFTKQQLEDIMAELNKISVLSDHTKDAILSNLENVMTDVFKVGEVYAYRDSNVWRYRSSNGGIFCSTETCRHLTPEEVPALALAMEQLEYIRLNVAHDEHIEEVAQTALDDIKAML